MEVVDYSFQHPDPRKVAEAGFVGAMRYLGGSLAKRLTGDELDELHAAGLAVGVVFEAGGDRAGKGATAGQLDGIAANDQADDLGFPDDRPIFYAVDYDAEPAAVLPYFRGVVAAKGRRVGVYGSFRVVEAVAAAGLASFVWQCAAWSHGKRSNRAVLFQYARSPRIPGTDENEVLASDWGGWLPHDQKDDDMTPEQEAKLDRLLAITESAQAGDYGERAGFAPGSLGWADRHITAPILAAIGGLGHAGTLSTLTPDDLERIATAVADEQARRQQA